MRLRHGAESVSRQASRNPQLANARLYVITPDAPAERVLEIATGAARGGADVVQLRQKTMPRGELLELARRLRTMLIDSLFVVNDHVDIALLSGADGVHLGPDDLSIAGARKVAAGRLLIGASASTLERAREAVAAGADYLGTGPAFATPIKAEKKVLGPEGIAAIASAVELPVFAIGGIDASNLGQVMAAGLRRVCVIRAVGDASDPEKATRKLRAMLDAT